MHEKSRLLLEKAKREHEQYFLSILQQTERENSRFCLTAIIIVVIITVALFL
jgi:hypothetical protein